MESQNNFHLGLWATCIVAYLKTARNCEMANLDLLPENEAAFFSLCIGTEIRCSNF